MTKQEIIETLEICISLMESSQNVYVKNQLTKVAEALVNDWNRNEYYVEQIKQVLNYDETMENLNNINIR
jgi:hypothetical protein